LSMCTYFVACMYTFGAYVGSVLNIVAKRPLNLFKNNGAFSFAKKTREIL
jgi:hypothetical protein